MRITESKLRRIIRDIIIEEENLNEGVLDFFMGSEEYRYVKKLSENIVKLINANHVASYGYRGSYGIKFENVNLEIASEGGPYISGSLVLVDIGGNKKYLYEVESHVGYSKTSIHDTPQMNVYFTSVGGGDKFDFTSSTGEHKKEFKADFCVSTNVTFESIQNDSYQFFQRLSTIFFERKSQLDRERSKIARIEREERKAANATKMRIKR